MKINKFDTNTGELIESIEFVDGKKVRYETVDLYQELLMAVKNEYDGLTKHEAVLFLLDQAQNTGSLTVPTNRSETKIFKKALNSVREASVADPLRQQQDAGEWLEDILKDCELPDSE